MAGRGRGHGPAIIPFTDEETGKRVTLDVDAPPPLFPAVELPPVPEATEEEKALLAIWQKLLSTTRASPYHLSADEPHGKAASRAGDTEPRDAALPADGKGQRALEHMLTLNPAYFPEELFTSTQRRQSERASAAQAFGDRDINLGADFFERFDRLDKAAGEGDEVGEGPEGANGGGSSGRTGDRRSGAAVRKPGGGEDEEEEEGGEADEEEAGFEEDDDYLQGVTYDDDEGYEDTLDDGGDEGPTY